MVKTTIRHNSRVFVGWTTRSSMQIHYLMDELHREWRECYHVIGRNCNDFADALCRILTGQGIPPWVNHLACTGTTLCDLMGVGPEGKFRWVGVGVAHGRAPKEIKLEVEVNVEASRDMAASLLLAEKQDLMCVPQTAQMGERICLPTAQANARMCSFW